MPKLQTLALMGIVTAGKIEAAPKHQSMEGPGGGW